VSAGGGTVDHALDAGIQVLGTDGVSGSTATPAPGYRFEGWYVGDARVDGAGAALGADEAAANVASSGGVRSDTTFTARFVADGAQTYDVAYVSAGGGTVDHALDAGIQVLGTDGVSGSTATPAPGYRFEGWYVGDARVDGAGAALGADEAAANVASSGGVRSDTTFTARFVADGAQTYDVAYVSAGGGHRRPRPRRRHPGAGHRRRERLHGHARPRLQVRGLVRGRRQGRRRGRGPRRRRGRGQRRLLRRRPLRHHLHRPLRRRRGPDLRRRLRERGRRQPSTTPSTPASRCWAPTA